MEGQDEAGTGPVLTDELFSTARTRLLRGEDRSRVASWLEGELAGRRLPETQQEELRHCAFLGLWEGSLAEHRGVPKNLRMASFERARETASIVAALEFLQPTEEHLSAIPHGQDDVYALTRFGAGRCLILSGPTGVGKSYAATCLMRRVARTPSRYWYFPALCGAWLDPERRHDALNLSKNIDLAVFDDFGGEYVKSGGLVESFLDELIWYREGHSLATVLTTNLTADQLKQRLSDRIVDRFRGAWGSIYECPGDSLRGTT